MRSASMDYGVSAQQDTQVQGSDGENQENGRKKQVRWGNEVDDCNSNSIRDGDQGGSTSGQVGILSLLMSWLYIRHADMSFDILSSVGLLMTILRVI